MKPTLPPYRAVLISLVAPFLVTSGSFAQDPVTLSPAHYKVELENEYVRVLRSSGPGHTRTPMHTHPVNVVVYLTDAEVRVGGPDGTAKDSHRKRGEVIWNGAQKHERLNLSDKPYEWIQVELKGPQANRGAIPPSLDPVRIVPEQFSVIFENEWVRAVRVKRGPRSHAAMHRHPPFVGVFLSDMNARITNSDGTVREARRKAGDVNFAPATHHAEANMSGAPFEAVLIELK